MGRFVAAEVSIQGALGAPGLCRQNTDLTQDGKTWASAEDLRHTLTTSFHRGRRCLEFRWKEFNLRTCSGSGGKGATVNVLSCPKY